MKFSKAFRVILVLIPALALAVLGVCLHMAGWFRFLSVDPPTNLLIVSIDSLRLDHLGCYGYARNTSPRLDAFAKNAIVFDRAYSPASWTAPSLASLMTSLPPRDLRIKSVADELDDKFCTLAEYFQANQFATAGFVSHNILEPAYGFAQGFEKFDTSVLGGRVSHNISTSKELTDLVIQSLRQRDSRPFFYWVHYFDPHFYYLSHEGYDFGDRDADRYDSEIAFTDRHLGRLIQALEDLKLLENTAVVFVADHGEEFYDHGGTFHGRTIFDEVVHIPLIVYIPGCRPGRDADPIIMSDLAPTLLDLMGFHVPTTFVGTVFPYRYGRFSHVSLRILFFENHDQVDWQGARLGRWKITKDFSTATWALYNTNTDPAEKIDLKDKRAIVFKYLKKAVEKFYAENQGVPRKKALTPEEIEHLMSLGYLQK